MGEIKKTKMKLLRILTLATCGSACMNLSSLSNSGADLDPAMVESMLKMIMPTLSLPDDLSELTDEALKQIESGLIENGAEANPDGLNNLMKMLRALSANTTTTRSSTTTTTTTTPTTTTTTTTTTSTTKAPKMIDQHPLYKTDMLESEDIYHKSIMTMAEASITDEFELTGGRPYIPRS